MDWKKVKKHVASTTVEERNAKRQAASERDVEILKENYGKVASEISNDAESRDYVSSAKTAANAGAISALERRRQRAEEYLKKNSDKYKNGKELLSETKNLFTSIEDLANANLAVENYWGQFGSEEGYNDYFNRIKEQERLEYMNVKEARDKKYALEQELNSLRGKTGGTTSIVSSALSSKGGIYDPSSRIETDKVRALQDEINALDRDINLASRKQTNKYLTDRAVSAEDFGEYSFNPIIPEKEYNIYKQANRERDNSAERFMTEDEKAIYNYYFNKVGEAKAEEYLDSIQEDLNFRQAKAIFEGNEDNVLAQLALMAPTQGLEQSKSGFQGALRMVMGDDSYQPVSTYDYLGQMAKEDLADKGFKLPEWMGGQSIGQLAYDLINTGANMAPSIAVGALTGTGPFAFGASAAGNAYTQKINEGYSKDQATAYGVIIGVSEATLEKVVGAIGFGGKTLASKTVAKLLPKIDNAAARIAVKYGSSMLSEGVEEGLQEVLEPLYRNAAFGENNELEITEDAIYSALLGALSGGLMEGTPYAISEGINASYQNKINEKYGKSVGEIVTEGLSAPQDSEAYKLAKEAKAKLNAGEELSEEELDVLAKVSAEVPQERKQAVTEASEEKPIVLQSKEIPNPGRRTVGISEKQMETFASKLPNATKDTGKQVAAMYDIKDGVSKETFIRGVDEAYRYGSMNFSVAEMDRGGSFAKDIPSEKKLQAYYMGQRNAETATITKANEQQKKALSGVKGKVVFEGNAATQIKNDKQRSTIRFINSVLKNASSIEYHIFASYEEDGKRVYKNSEGKVIPAPNGFYNPTTHQIWIDINAGAKGQGIVLYTLTHEHVHDIKVWSAEHYNELVKITSQAFEHAGKSFKEAVDAKYAQYVKNHPDTTYEEAQEEVVAEAMSGLLSDENGLRKFSEQIQKQDKSLWNRIKEWFNDVIARITAAYKGIEPESEEAKLLMEQKELFEHAQKIFAEAVVTAGQNYKNAGVEIDADTESVALSNTKFQDRDSEYIEAVKAGDMKTAQRLVDEAAKAAGYNIHAFHGTSRGDRVGNVFLPERATSGPMAFFTDDKATAEGYATGKRDTSIAYDPDFDSYETQFRVKVSGMDIPFHRAWGYLPFDARNRVAKKAGQLREDWDGDNELILDPETNEANGGFQWQLKEARGNVIKALIDQWLNSGNLFNEEAKFLDVIEMSGLKEEFAKVGINTIYFKDPNARYEKVYDVYLKMNRPFDTAKVNKRFVTNLLKWYDKQDERKYQRENMESDLWDKNGIDAYEFAERLERDIENNTTHAWTSIPDSVTDYLKHLKYDGVKDLGGKFHETTHTVWIPFYSEQIKTTEPVTYDDRGNVIPLSERFKEENKDIRYSLRNKVDSFNINEYNEAVGNSKISNDFLSEAMTWYADKINEPFKMIYGGYVYICTFDENHNLTIYFRREAKNIHEREDYIDAYTERKRFDRSNGGRGNKQEGNNFDSFMSGNRTDAGNDGVYQRGNETQRKNNGESDNQSRYDSDERKWRDFVDYFFEDGKQFYQDRLSAADKNRLEILGNKTNRLSSDLKTLEKTFGKLVKEEFEKNIAPNEGLSKRAEAINEKAARRFMNEVGAMFAVPKETREEYLLPIINEIIDKGPARSESEGLVEKLYETAYDHTEDYIVDTDPDGAYKNLRNYIRKTLLFIDNGTKADVGDYNTFRKANMGNLSLTSDAKAIPLDGFYDEVSKIAPEIFSGTIDGAEQLYELSSFMKDRGRTESIGDFMPKEEYVSWADESLGVELQNLYDVTISGFLSEATRKEKERTKAAKVMGAMESVKDVGRKQAELERKIKGYETAIAKKKEQISAVRQQKNDLLAKAKAERAEAVERVRKADRERMEKAIADIKATERAKFNAAKERSDEQKRAIIEKYQTSIKKATEGRHRTDIRGKIKRVVNELNTLLTKQTKERHIPLELQKPVADALDILNLDDQRYYESRIRGLEARIAEAKSSEERHLLQEELNKIIDHRAAFKDKIAGLKKAYEAIKTSTDPYIAVGYNENIAKMIDRVAEDIGDTLLRDMSMTQLQEVYDLYKGILKTVRDANKFFNEEKGASVVEAGRNVVSEIEASGKTIDQISKKKLERKKFFWNNLKPVYAFKKLGSKTLENLFGGILKGQGTWAKDVSEAKDFFERIGNKYGYKKWDKKKTFEFTSNTGKKFSLNLQQMMSLYAYSKRDQAFKHLTDGGFVFDNKETIKKNGKEYVVNTAQAYNISAATLQQIIGKLSTDQRMFVDEMQKYLSETMGAKGNEVSRAMYDIELFREAEGYFPLKSAKQFLYDRNEVTNETRQLVNSGFTKPIQPGANNPIILTGFMNVWANHVNDMSMYHAFVMPIENFNKVYNFQFGRSEDSDSKSVKSAIQDSFTEAANQYIEQLLKDINGGARVDSRESTYKRLVGNWKKAAVFASASVVVQQPSAIGRAFAEINPVYFMAPTEIGVLKHKKQWEQLKKYAPVAVIKEMGYFDTDMGQSTAEFIKGEKTLKDRADDVFGFAPAKADEYTWCAIWDAVKRETKAKHKDLNVNSEEFLKIAGERFTEVIDKTQVYDSVLARSGNMRSKSIFMQMLTAFMAEPTTSANMVEQAFREAKAGHPKKAMAYINSVGASVIINSFLVSFVYALRDEDEDERFHDKYLEALLKELVDGFNPLTYIPLAKDIWSIFQGWDVERVDMSLFKDLYDNLEKEVKKVKELTEGIMNGTLSEEEIKAAFGEILEEYTLPIIDTIASMKGIPLKNLRRDFYTMPKNTIKIFENQKDLSYSEKYLMDVLGRAALDQLPLGHIFMETKGDRLIDGMKAGDRVYLERLKATYSTEEAYNSAIKAAIKDAFINKEISAAKAEELLVKYHGDEQTDAEIQVTLYDLQRRGFDDVTFSNAKDYKEFCEPYGISEKVFFGFCLDTKDIKGDYDAEGDSIPYSKTKKIMPYIDRLPLTAEQKTAVAKSFGWSDKTIREYKLW